MANFRKRQGSEKPGRPAGGRTNRTTRTEDSGKGGKSSYKAGRSFSKNKDFRENKPAGKPRRPFDAGGPRKRDRDERESASERVSRRPVKEEGRRPFRESGRPARRDDARENYRERSEGTERKSSRFGKREDDHREPRSRETRGKDIKKKSDKFEGFKNASENKQTRGRKKDSEPGSEKKRRLTKPRKSEEEGASSRRVRHEELEDGNAFYDHRASRDRKEGGRSPKKGPSKKQQGDSGLVRLNKYLSNAGIASRRDADNLILSGVVKVNGVVVNELGVKIKPTDKVTYADESVKAERKVYLLLNKPKDYITTVDDPRERRTVMELIQGACKERVYPVGRLDRNTTGLLLFTNDGEMTTRLTHPKFGIKKVYHVSLNKGLKASDFKAIIEGVELEDGQIKADDLAFVGEGKKEVGIEIHSGRNRIVRRLFEHLGYDVLKLDRVLFAGLTKKDLPRGKYRFLTSKEVAFLQMIG
jgi:23S rRNA pseudouridine2605 synthase